MEYDTAIVLLSAVVILLVTILLGVVYAVARDGREAVDEEWLHRLDELDARLAAMTQRSALLDAEIRHLEELEAVDAEAASFRDECDRLRTEYTHVVELLARIARLLEEEARRLSGKGAI